MSEGKLCERCGSEHDGQPVVIREAADLTQLVRWIGRRDAVCLALPWARQPEYRTLQQELERDYLECGCSAGRVGLLLGLATGSAAIGLAGATTPTTLETVLIPLASSVSFGLAAGGWAILRARVRLARRVRALQTELAQVPYLGARKHCLPS